MAFAAFADAPIEVAVVEVGLGGRWDATNVVNAPVAVITPISVDHVEYLGGDIAGIAGEKAGIISKADEGAPDTVAVIGSACNYGYGTIDPIAELGELALAEAALLVHLRQPVLRVHVAEREEEVVLVLGVDRGEPGRGERDRDRLGQPRDVERLRAHGPAVGGRRPRTPARVEGGAEGRDRPIAEAEDAEQQRGHDQGADRT